jgi:archaellum component FlaG (FlaF/FlaG flagellin family)
VDKIFVTAFLVIAGVISAVFAFNAIYPAIVQSSDAMTSMERRMDERLKSQIEIIHAARSGSDALIWVKNVGSVRLAPPEASDLFFGPQGNFARIPYGTGLTHWEYVVENGDEWNPTATLKITVVNYAFSGPGARYFVKFVLPNGVDHEYFFSE